MVGDTLCIGAIIALFAAPDSGFANPPEREAAAAPRRDERSARELYRVGQAAFDAGRFREALRIFHDAYRALPANGFHFNIAQCHRRLGEFEAALAAFHRFLAGEHAGTSAAKLARRAISETKREQVLQEATSAIATTPIVDTPKTEARSEGGWLGGLASNSKRDPWSGLGSQTNAEGRHALVLDVAWPRTSIAYLYGVTPRLTVGAKVGFAWEPGTVSGAQDMASIAMTLQASLRLQFLARGRLTLTVLCEPGMSLHFAEHPAFMLFLPAEIQLGVALTPRLSIATGLRVLTWVPLGAVNPIAAVSLLGAIGIELQVHAAFVVFVRGEIGQGFRVRASETLLAPAFGGGGGLLVHF